MSKFSPWGPISSILFELSSDTVQSIIERAGITPDWSLTKEEAFSHKTRNRAFRTKINKFVKELDSKEKDLFIINVAKGLMSINSEHRDTISDLLQNIGWAMHNDKIIPIAVVDPKELKNLPESAHDDLSKAAEKLPNDLSGAITNACGAVESVCSEIYENYNLGDISKARSFQEKVNVSLTAVDVFRKMEEELIELAWNEKEAKDLCKELKKAINRASSVMQTVRSKMGDVHGSKPTLAVIAYDSIKWSMIIASLLNDYNPSTNEHNETRSMRDER